MTTVAEPRMLLEEVAEFLATRPTKEELLAYRPSTAAQERLSALLSRAKNEELTADENTELDQFEQVELLMRLVKARLRSLAS